MASSDRIRAYKVHLSKTSGGLKRRQFSYTLSRKSKSNVDIIIYQYYLIIGLYFLLSPSYSDGILFQGNVRNVVTALLPTPTTKHLAYSRKHSIGIRGRQNSWDQTGTGRALSGLSLSAPLENVFEENNSDDDLVGWRSNLPGDVYASPLLWESQVEWKSFMKQFQRFDEEEMTTGRVGMGDHLWEQVKLEALTQLRTEPEAGPQLYQSILSQGSLVEAIVSIIAST